MFATQTASYELRARIASAAGGGSFRLDFDGVDRTGTVVVPSTGGWQSWVDVDFAADLDNGIQVMRFVPLSGEFNLNWIEADVVATSAPVGADRAVIEDLSSYPNPFNPRTSIRFTLGSPVTVDLVVYSAAGRAVRTITAGEALAAGRHERTWDGRDEHGGIVSAGVYFARLRAGDAAETVRLVLLK